MVHRSDQEVARSHRDVSNTEVEERLGGVPFLAVVEEHRDAVEMFGERGVERRLEQVLDREFLRKVGTGGFARPGRIVEVDLSWLIPIEGVVGV
ncbi:hypothetical protein GCM10025864_08770 [Luteimicrobium album]|uniref:Uncharacterized protein n=1 Tax=Luteimicrobium album TaxID=1054550 RepID=A0ABQ6HZ15_9MICO|nr:hypothetical protein GCM10025864_08770 [Luteimicrobium album]